MRDIRSNILILTLGIGAAIFTTGQFGLLLAVPPGNVSLFWPPAGIALGSLLLFGKKSVPGILIGAFFTEIFWPGLPSGVSSLAFATSLSAGALLQAVWGRWLLRQSKTEDSLFVNRQSTQKFLLLTPVIALCNSTLGTGVLFATGSLDISLPLTWITWWVGDVLGLAAFTPIVFGIRRRVDHHHRSSLIMLTLTMTMVTILALISSIYLGYRLYIATAQSHLLELAQIQSNIIESAIQFDDNIDLPNSVVGQGAEVLHQMNNAFDIADTAGEASEYLLARNNSGLIEYILSKNSSLENLPDNLAIDGQLAQPMGRALSGDTGTMIGLNFRGEQVLAGYVYSPALGTGMVAYRTLDEFRKPFVKNTQIIVLISLTLVALGIVTFDRISTPIARALEMKSQELQKLVDEQTRNLLESKEEFRQLVESAPDAILITSEDGVIRMINNEVTRLTGYRDEELVGQSVEQLLPFSYRRTHLKHRINYLQSPTVRQMGTGRTLFCKRKDGSVFATEIALSPIHTKREILVAASMRDITEQELYQEKLRKNEERLEQAFSAANMEAWELDLNSGKMTSSWYLYKRFGFDTNAISNGQDPWPDIMLSADRTRIENSLKYFILGNSHSFKETFRVHDVNGSIRWIELIAKPIEYNKKGEVISLIGIRIDVTEHMEVNVALKSKISELEEYNVLVRGRELRMIELKGEINRLLRQLGYEKKYEVPD